MTRKGAIQSDAEERRIIRRLLQLHHETSPVALAKLFGFSAEYIRRLWRKNPGDVASLERALERLND